MPENAHLTLPDGIDIGYAVLHHADREPDRGSSATQRATSDPVRDLDQARPAIAIHGFRGERHGLQLICERLRRVVYVPDLPGFGESGEYPRHDLAAFVRFTSDFIAALDLPVRPLLIGHSFGTIVTAAFAAEHPEAIDRLALINPIATAPTSGPRKAATAVAMGYYRLGAALPGRVGRGLLASRIGNEAMSLAMTKTKNKPLRRYIRDQHNRYFSAFGSRRALLEAFDVSTHRTVAEFADRLTMPTLLVAGELDDLASVEDQQALAAAISDSRLVVIGGTGHLTHYEAPDRVARAIEEFA